MGGKPMQFSLEEGEEEHEMLSRELCAKQRP